jgi:hypothetical protein
MMEGEGVEHPPAELVGGLVPTGMEVSSCQEVCCVRLSCWNASPRRSRVWVDTQDVGHLAGVCRELPWRD